VVLVTHFMEEAERLCDRVAVIDAGRVVAIDTPAGLAARVSASQSIRFRPSAPLDEGLLADLPEVSGVRRIGGLVQVSGSGNLLGAVVARLAHHRIVAADLRVEQATLDDAFVALTASIKENNR
jgi:ABC-2 type transport system ATP-binding protein